MGITGKIRGIVVAIGCLVASTGGAIATQVTLSAIDNSASVTGELLSFDGKTYSVKTGVGTLEIAAGMVNCTGEACPEIVDETRFAVVGSNAFGQGLMPSLIQYFALMNQKTVEEGIGADSSEKRFTLTNADGTPYVDIDVLSNGSAHVVDALKDGSAQIGMLAKPLDDAQKQEISDAVGPTHNTATEYAVAADGLVVIVSPDNSIDAISEAQISKVFSGQIKNWSELGGPDHAINTYMLKQDMGESSSFTNHFLTAKKLGYGADVKEIANTSDLNIDVAEDVYGIGFTNIGNVTSAKVLPIRGQCGIVSHPSEFAIRAGEYPLASQLYLVDSGVARSKAQQAFMEFVKSPEAQAAVHSAGFIDDFITTESLDSQGSRLLNMILTDQENITFSKVKKLAKELRGAVRVSTTFRFTYGIAELDQQSTHNMVNLARFIGSHDMSGKELLVIGFTDSVGSASNNASLSARRADFVSAELHTALGVDGQNINIVSRGYGESSPLDCNIDESGRNINRRVEVWIRDAR